MQAQSKLKIGPQAQPGQIYDNGFAESQLGMKMPNTESFDKILSQRRLNQQIDLTQANLIDRVCEKSGADNNDNDDEEDEEHALQIPQSKVQKLEQGLPALGLLGGASAPALARSLQAITQQQHNPNQVQPQELPDLSLQNLQKMVTDMNDDSTPSRDKDQSSRLNGDLEESSGRVVSCSAVVKSEVAAE